MQDNAYLMYTLSDRAHYESLSKRTPSTEYSDVVNAALPEDWRVYHQGVWTEALPLGDASAKFGWKIHLSVLPVGAKAMLAVVVPELVAAGAGFKFCSDRRMHELTHNKNWPRTQIGKFITVYPESDSHFRSLIERLHVVTRDFSGPYVLTDKHYKDSKCVFYRYGAHEGTYRLEHNGYRVSGFRLTDGSWLDDIREPGAFNPLGLPIDFDDPLPDVPPPSSVLLCSRYRIISVIKFTGEGGTYFGHDEILDADVVVREHRYGLGGLAGVDDLPHGFAMKNEANILAKLSDTGVTAKFVDCFEEDMHWFLVQERLDGFETMWGIAMNFYFTRDKQSAAETFVALRDTFRRIADALEKIHARNVVMRDLTKTNVMSTLSGDIRFIDFEFAYDLDGDGPWVRGWTAGYASKEQRADEKPSFSDDYYAFGALILDLLTFSSSGFDLNREGVFLRLRMNLADLGFPAGVEKIVRALTDPDKAARWDIRQAIEALDALDPGDKAQTPFPTLMRDNAALDPEKYQDILSGLARHLAATATLERGDRLWPASAEVWTTNPVSIKHGAAGTSYFFLYQCGEVPSEYLDWILARTRKASCPPGLYSGMAGVACFLLDAGRRNDAIRIMDEAMEHELLHDLPHGFTTGLAGVGTALLTFFLATRDQRYLTGAVDIAQRLVTRAIRTADGICWSSESVTALGFAYGASGVALFLMQCSLASGRDEFMVAAREALDYDLSFRVDRSDRVLWQHYAESRKTDPHTPHVLAGTAGVGMVALRAWMVTGDASYLKQARACAYTLADRFTNKIWQLEGLSGIGEFILDMTEFAPNWHPRSKDIAYHLAEGILPYVVREAAGSEIEGVTFAGVDHFRICADYAYGSAGVGVFLERLVSGRRRLFMLDELFERAAKTRVT